MSRFGSIPVTAVGSYGFSPTQGPGAQPTLHISGSNSFQLVVMATNFVTTSAGSNWTAISSPILTPGLYNFPSASYGATLFQVNSIVGSMSLAIG